MSPEDNQALTQADIDAMVATEARQAPPQAAPVPAPAAPQAAPAAVVAPAAPAPAAPQAAPAAVVAPAAPAPVAPLGVPAAVVAPAAPAPAAPQAVPAAVLAPAAPVPASPQTGRDIAALTQRIQNLEAELTAIKQASLRTPGYDLRRTFECGSCGAEGGVAARVVCTHCKGESLVGWAPRSSGKA